MVPLSQKREMGAYVKPAIAQATGPCFPPRPWSTHSTASDSLRLCIQNCIWYYHSPCSYSPASGKPAEQVLCQRELTLALLDVF